MIPGRRRPRDQTLYYRHTPHSTLKQLPRDSLAHFLSHKNGSGLRAIYTWFKGRLVGFPVALHWSTEPHMHGVCVPLRPSLTTWLLFNNYLIVVIPAGDSVDYGLYLTLSWPPTNCTRRLEFGFCWKCIVLTVSVRYSHHTTASIVRAWIVAIGTYTVSTRCRQDRTIPEYYYVVLYNGRTSFGWPLTSKSNSAFHGRQSPTYWIFRVIMPPSDN